jgi:hypothetical protein
MCAGVISWCNHKINTLAKPYKYHLRPGYGSDELLLEFFLDDTDTAFNTDLLATLQAINPQIEAVQDLWMNDEVIFQISSSEGSFSLSKDIWGFAFIMAGSNQLAVKHIAKILAHSALFEKEEVDFNNYKNAEE